MARHGKRRSIRLFRSICSHRRIVVVNPCGDGCLGDVLRRTSGRFLAALTRCRGRRRPARHGPHRRGRRRGGGGRRRAGPLPGAPNGRDGRQGVRRGGAASPRQPNVRTLGMLAMTPNGCHSQPPCLLICHPSVSLHRRDLRRRPPGSSRVPSRSLDVVPRSIRVSCLMLVRVLCSRVTVY